MVNTKTSPSQPLLTRSQVADLLQISTRTVIRWTNDGTLPCTRLGPDGRTIRYRRQDVDALVERTASW